MKTLVEKSIDIRGIGHPETKTIFNIENEVERNHFRFKPLTTISKRKLSVFFKYEENGSEKVDKLQISVISSDSEDDIKSFILQQINDYLSNS